MWKIALIGACGGAGAILRHLVSVWSLHWFGSGFPVGTLIVNVVGCFLLGTLYELTETTLLISGEWRHALGVGFLGGLTTFSTFGYETHSPAEFALASRCGECGVKRCLGAFGSVGRNQHREVRGSPTVSKI